MKKIFLFACAALTLAACTNDDDDKARVPDSGTDPTLTVISFESSEGLEGIDDKPVVLGESVVLGSVAGGSWSDIYWFKLLADYESYLKTGEYGSEYDGEFFRTADGSARFGIHFSTGEFGDSWGGFALSANYTKKVAEQGYPQFTAWADGGANGSAICAIGYNSSYTGGPVYAAPTIEFAEAVRMSHCFLANTAITYPYKPDPDVLPAADYYYKVIVAGSLAGVETARAECMLASGDSRADGWKKVDLSGLGKVDKIVFLVASNDANEFGLLAPAYFALDELAFEADK